MYQRDLQMRSRTDLGPDSRWNSLAGQSKATTELLRIHLHSCASDIKYCMLFCWATQMIMIAVIFTLVWFSY